MSAKTLVKACWFVAITVSVLAVFASLGSKSYSLRPDQELNIHISPLKRIKVVQLVETEEEFPIEYRFVNSTESFDVYSYAEGRAIYDSKEVFGGAQEVHFWATYDTSFGVENVISGTTVGVRSSYPIGVEIRPDGMMVLFYSLWILGSGVLSALFVFGVLEE